MSALIERLRAARQFEIQAGGVTLVVRRPTDADVQGLLRRGDRLLWFADHVIDWRGMREIDLDPGGTSEPAPFDADLCREWLSDRSDLWAAISKPLEDAYAKHRESLGVAEKN